MVHCIYDIPLVCFGLNNEEIKIKKEYITEINNSKIVEIKGKEMTNGVIKTIININSKNKNKKNKKNIKNKLYKKNKKESLHKIPFDEYIKNTILPEKEIDELNIDTEDEDEYIETDFLDEESIIIETDTDEDTEKMFESRKEENKVSVYEQDVIPVQNEENEALACEQHVIKLNIKLKDS
jgi:hypothetical protein